MKKKEEHTSHSRRPSRAAIGAVKRSQWNGERSPPEKRRENARVVAAVVVAVVGGGGGGGGNTETGRDRQTDRQTERDCDASLSPTATIDSFGGQITTRKEREGMKK